VSLPHTSPSQPKSPSLGARWRHLRLDDLRVDGLHHHRLRVTGISWTSSSLGIDNYWFEVVAYIGANWASPASAATAESTVAFVCVQL
jgi:hypothetical protein